MTKLIKALPIFLLLLLVSCQKDEETFVPTESSTQSIATLTGIVTDKEDEPISNVSVSYNGLNVMTNSSGVYEFIGVSVDSKHNSIRIVKDGYFETARTFRTNSSDQLIHQTQLLEKKFDNSFEASIGGRVTEELASVSFNPNSIVYDGTEDPYGGLVKVAITYLDPSDIDLEKNMPGDLTSISDENILKKATPFGMAYVELESTNGEKLQIKKGEVATLSIEVPDELLSFAPETLIASHFDEALGVWKDETTASLVNGTYFSEVSHFSCWSYNSSSPSIVLSGRVIDETGTPVAGLHIQVSEIGEWTGGFGYTDENGIFTGAVPKDELLNIVIAKVEYCPGFQLGLLTDDIGPFSGDIDLGDLSVNLSDYESVTVNASFFNCDGEPVTNGLVHVARSYFKITDGTLNVTVPVCNENANYILWAHDLDTDKVTERYPLIVGQVNNYQDISICAIEEKYLEVSAPGLGIDLRTNIELFGGYNAENKAFQAIYNQGPSSGNVLIEFEYMDTNPNGFEEGTWDISMGVIETLGFPDVLAYSAAAGEGEVTISEIGTDGNGNYVKGNYRIDFTDVNTNVVYEFSGNFNVRTN